MGLDIGFNRAAAIAAGMEFKTIPNDGVFDEDDAPDYIEWCKASTNCIKVPDTDWYISDDGVGESIVVRANKWGSSYAPLTAWLTKHNIEWSEF